MEATGALVATQAIMLIAIEAIVVLMAIIAVVVIIAISHSSTNGYRYKP
jgi:hypothetical protein